MKSQVQRVGVTFRSQLEELMWKEQREEAMLKLSVEKMEKVESAEV